MRLVVLFPRFRALAVARFSVPFTVKLFAFVWPVRRFTLRPPPLTVKVPPVFTVRFTVTAAAATVTVCEFNTTTD